MWGKQGFCAARIPSEGRLPSGTSRLAASSMRTGFRWRASVAGSGGAQVVAEGSGDTTHEGLGFGLVAGGDLRGGEGGDGVGLAVGVFDNTDLVTVVEDGAGLGRPGGGVAHEVGGETVADEVVGHERADALGDVGVDVGGFPEGMEEVDVGAGGAGVGGGDVELGDVVATSVGSGLDGEGVGEVGLVGGEAFGRGGVEGADAVADGDAADVVLVEEAGDVGGRGEVEEGVGGDVVAEAGAEVEEVFDGDGDGVTELADAEGAGAGWSGVGVGGGDVDGGGAVEFVPVDAVEGGEGEGDFDEGGGGVFGVGFDADLVAGVEVADEEGAVESGFVEFGA